METARVPAWRRPWVLVAVTGLLVAVARLPSFVHQLFDPDEGALAAQAITLRHGGTIYADAIDRKPPIPAFLYTGVFDVTGSTDLRPVHVLAALFLLGAALVVAFEVRARHGSAAGWWAAVLMVTGAVAFLPTNGQAANYAHFALLPGAVAVVAARRPGWRWALLAGVALGLAVLCRQTWAIGLLPGAVAIGLRGRARDLPVFVGGCAATVGSVALVVPFHAFWSATFTGNESFVTSGADWGEVGTGLAGNLGLFVTFHVVAVVLLVIVARDDWRDRTQWRGRADLWLWLLTGAVAVVTGLRFYGHYWLQLLPPLVLLVAPAAAELVGRRRLLAGAGVVVATAVAWALAFTPGTVRTLEDPQPLAHVIDASDQSGGPILVWGNYPELYWAADRPVAGAFVTSNFVTGLSGNRAPGPATLGDATPGSVATFLAALDANPPVLIVDTSTADLREYGAYPMSVIPGLADFVRSHRYTVVARVGGVTVYGHAAGVTR